MRILTYIAYIGDHVKKLKKVDTFSTCKNPVPLWLLRPWALNLV